MFEHFAKALRQRGRVPILRLHTRLFIGYFWAGAIDRWNRRMPATRILALLRTDDSADDWILLGRWGGICENRFLYQEPTAHDEPEDGLPADAPSNFRRTYGMKLWLIDY